MGIFVLDFCNYKSELWFCLERFTVVEEVFAVFLGQMSKIDGVLGENRKSFLLELKRYLPLTDEKLAEARSNGFEEEKKHFERSSAAVVVFVAGGKTIKSRLKDLGARFTLSISHV